MNAAEFAAKWIGNANTERGAAQEHFIDICTMLGVPTPNTDREGEAYAFEKGVSKTSGGKGFADVWFRGHFAWEYKGHYKNLDHAYKQLLDYREALENPPLLVVCDLDRFIIRTNFTNTVLQSYTFRLEDLRDRPGEPLRILRALFERPEDLRPSKTRAELTEEAAGAFAALAQQLRDVGYEPQRVAHFLNKLLFVLFAEDSALLPAGLIRDLGKNLIKHPAIFTNQLSELFRLMSTKPGGAFGPLPIQWFNGGLFDGPDVLPLTTEQIEVITRVSRLDWSQVEPAVFGTLFERGLDPGKRSQLGAHYTDRTSIERVVYPVLIEPLEREWAMLRDVVGKLIAGFDLKRSPVSSAERAARTKALGRARDLVNEFLERLNAVRVLDPACGSGNFLYVALQALKDLERRVIVWEANELVSTMRFPSLGPHNVRGIELNSYAAELARVSIWIGEIQWMISNGFAYVTDPVLRRLENIECRDAVLDLSDPSAPGEPEWPDAYAIIGNPPFIGNKLLRTNLGDGYVEALFNVYSGRLSNGIDFVCYWHEKARAMVEAGRVKCVGLLATQGIRHGANRKVLDRIKETGDIFMAWSDETWVVEGASVHVSIVGYDDGSETHRVLDGVPVPAINSDLTTGVDLTRAKILAENAGLAFQGPVKVGPFEIDDILAQRMLTEPNPHGRSNRDVVKPWVVGLDIARRPRHMWIIDFEEMTEDEAALYEAPFEYVRQHVYPLRASNRDRQRRENWWRLGRSGADLQRATKGLARFLVTPRVSKHRFFVWVEAGTLPDSAVVAIARDDDYSFGILHSCVHELWARGVGSQLREAESGFRYTPRTTFETFPFPRPTLAQAESIAEAGLTLDDYRRRWLDPEGINPADLKNRTLTKLYNQRPSWLDQAHNRLDRAVFAAYGWPYPLDDQVILGRLLQLNEDRAARSGGVALSTVVTDSAEEEL
jgi:type II restriction/modification system DNA methylase subunit YeeA